MRGFVFSAGRFYLLPLVPVDQDEMEPDRLRVLERIESLVCAVHEQVQIRPLSPTGLRDCEEHGIFERSPVERHIQRYELLSTRVHAAPLCKRLDDAWQLLRQLPAIQTKHPALSVVRIPALRVYRLIWQRAAREAVKPERNVHAQPSFRLGRLPAGRFLSWNHDFPNVGVKVREVIGHAFYRYRPPGEAGRLFRHLVDCFP